MLCVYEAERSHRPFYIHRSKPKISITALVCNIPNLSQQTKIKAPTFTFTYIDLYGL